MSGAEAEFSEITRRLVLGELAAINRQDPHGLADPFAEHCEFVDLSDRSRINRKADFLEDLASCSPRCPTSTSPTAA